MILTKNIPKRIRDVMRYEGLGVSTFTADVWFMADRVELVAHYNERWIQHPPRSQFNTCLKVTNKNEIADIISK